MRYTFNELEKAIGIIFPVFNDIKKNGVEYNVPSWLKMCAEDYFLKQFEESDRRDTEKMEAYGAVHSALKDLHEKGFMQEGTGVLVFLRGEINATN